MHILTSRVSSSCKGEVIAALLSGAWCARPVSPREVSAADLDAIAPLLQETGAAGLAWWRTRGTDILTARSAALLEESYRYQALQAAIHEDGIRRLFRLLREAAVPAILAKGWAAARHYPDMALRPYGDIDVLVAPEHFQTATEVLRAPELRPFFYDLHDRFKDLPERKFEQLHARSKEVVLGDDCIRTLGLEDHLALLCVHFLRHGGYRPIWLCDIAAIAEALPAEFDWTVCLGDDPRRASWILCALTLARRLLDANVPFPPGSREFQNVPEWLIRTVLEEWSNDYASERRPMPIADRLRHGQAIRTIALARWPNPIDATICLNASINSMPRWPYQLAILFSRAMRYAKRLVRGDAAIDPPRSETAFH